jgi:hypothetical protein
MITYDYSQLPVVEGDREPRYMVTSDSILRALEYFGTALPRLSVGDAVVSAPTFSLDTDLLDILDPLRDASAVLILGAERRLEGIVTSYDTTEFLRRQTEDALLVRDVEEMVRDLILAGLGVTEEEVDSESVRATINVILQSEDESSTPSKQLDRFKHALFQVLKRQGTEATLIPDVVIEQAYEQHLRWRAPHRNFDELTLNEYTKLLLDESRWPCYAGAIQLDRESVGNALLGVRRSRNQLFHFRGDLSSKQRDQLRFSRDWLERHRLKATVITSDDSKSEGPNDLITHSPVTNPEEGPSEDSLGLGAPLDEQLDPKESRYAALALFLQGQPSKIRRVPMSFADIEQTIGEQVPPSARKHRAWWANDPSSDNAQSVEWLQAGWHVGSVDLTGEQVIFVRTKEREQQYIHFFDSLLNQLRTEATFQVQSPSWPAQSWLPVGRLTENGSAAGQLIVSFARRQRLRVELYISTGDRDRNKRIFDQLRSHSGAIEQVVGEPLSWERLDDRNACRVALYREGQPDNDPVELHALQVWAVDALNRLAAGIREHLTL